MSDGAQWWLVYVRWPTTGKLETFRTTRPSELSAFSCWVMACLPIARMSVQPVRCWAKRT